MSIRDDFFAAQAKASLWDVAVSIKRGNPLPLDANAVYASYGTIVKTEVVDGVEKHTYTAGSLLEYAKTNPVAYPGQICAVVDVNATTIYYLDQNLEIQPVGIIPSGDDKTVEVTEDGVISLLGAAEAANGTIPMLDSTTGKLVWKTPEDIGAGDGNTKTVVASGDGRFSVTDNHDTQSDTHTYTITDNGGYLVASIDSDYENTNTNYHKITLTHHSYDSSLNGHCIVAWSSEDYSESFYIEHEKGDDKLNYKFYKISGTGQTIKYLVK
jgi:hypothetical protein